MGSSGPSRLQRRNVEVFDSEGAVIAGFWQYGTLQWDEFYRYIIALTVTEAAWSIFRYDLAQQKPGTPCPSGAQLVQPGHYVLLSTTGEPIRVGLVATRPRPRPPSIPAYFNPPSHDSRYCIRGRIRDGKCLITGLQTQTYSRLKVAHIFPQVHDTEWVRRGYPSKITDTTDEAHIGGRTKIDSVQNLITLRSDLHDAWDNYEFGVNPKNGYRITAFTNGNADINGLRLQLNHIKDPTLHPLDELLTDHFMQGLLMHMKGAGEPAWTYEDYDDAVGDGSDLSNSRVWGTSEGRELFELTLADRLFGHQIS
ncbi:hypothetical protein EDD17DRAFT_1758995 [Pisolithus thermaeus]|nr:hypothetical protein EV401DRAFT_2069705 [Pisolithus croceorrhizus]KAI6161549.1 hypothetical protein EDD17DRAFT_1758995 [Pisolithus thermaeus]